MRAAIERHRRGLDANPVGYLHANEGRLTRRARAAAGRYLGVPAAELALTDSTTMGLGLLYGGLRLGAGDEVLTTEHDFYATHEALRLRGARVRRVRLYDDPRAATVDEIVDAAPPRRPAADAGRRAHLGALEHRREAAGARDRRALPERVLLCVDGVHGFGVEERRAGDARLRRLRSRLPQVALRPARHRLPLGERARARAAAAGDPVLRRRRELRRLARGRRARRARRRRRG